MRNKIGQMIKDFISHLQDPRRVAGTRYSFDTLITLIILGTSMGYIGYRELHRFVKKNADYLVPELALTHRIPCHNTFRRLLQELKSEDVINAFNAWARKHYPIVAGSALSVDGQALRSTVSNPHESNQNFVTIVSLFTTKTSITHAIAAAKEIAGQRTPEKIYYTEQTAHSQNRVRLARYCPKHQKRG